MQKHFHKAWDREWRVHTETVTLGSLIGLSEKWGFRIIGGGHSFIMISPPTQIGGEGLAAGIRQRGRPAAKIPFANFWPAPTKKGNRIKCYLSVDPKHCFHAAIDVQSLSCYHCCGNRCCENHCCGNHCCGNNSCGNLCCGSRCCGKHCCGNYCLASMLSNHCGNHCFVVKPLW